MGKTEKVLYVKRELFSPYDMAIPRNTDDRDVKRFLNFY